MNFYNAYSEESLTTVFAPMHVSLDDLGMSRVVNSSSSSQTDLSAKDTEYVPEGADESKISFKPTKASDVEHVSEEKCEQLEENATSTKAPAADFAKDVDCQLKGTQVNSELDDLQRKLDSFKSNLNHSLQELVQKFKTDSEKKLSDMLHDIEEALATDKKGSALNSNSSSNTTVGNVAGNEKSASTQRVKGDSAASSNNHRPVDGNQGSEEHQQQQGQHMDDGKPVEAQWISDLRPKVVEDVVFELTKNAHEMNGPYKGTAYQFLKDFEFFFSSVADDDIQKSLCFRQILSKGKPMEWTWVTYEPYDTPYTVLKELFLWRHFSRSVQNEIYKEFKESKCMTSDFENATDYVSYWINRLEGVEVEEQSVVQTFIENLPDALQKFVFEKNPKTLKALKQMVRNLPMDVIVFASDRDSERSDDKEHGKKEIKNLPLPHSSSHIRPSPHSSSHIRPSPHSSSHILSLPYSSSHILPSPHSSSHILSLPYSSSHIPNNVSNLGYK